LITAVDTNVLFDLFSTEAEFASKSSHAVRRCIREGSVIACEVVWAEAAAAFSDPRKFRESMAILTASYSPITEDAAILASQAWQKYRARGGPRNRIVPDFLIGAHALVSADRLLTRDRGFYRSYFRSLRVVDPTLPR
jgi:hypothetical protein